MKNHILGIPRFGAKRELKKAFEYLFEGENIRHPVWQLRQDHLIGQLAYPERHNPNQH